MNAQTSLLDEITVDCFAGGGGWSTGEEQALGEPVTIAINHDAAAIAMHRTNHPYTEHYCEDIFEVDPCKAVRGRAVGWAHFSPDCKHFSKAKGGKPVEKKIRGLAYVVLKWAGKVQPRIVSLENVEEFLTWGPLVALRDKNTGRIVKQDGTVALPGERTPLQEQRLIPDKRRAGRTFRKFVRELRALGYVVEWRILVAADYGAPTTRKRLFILARRDGKPIAWPEATHAPKNSQDVQAGGKAPWRSAAGIIDWSLPCPSIFESKQEIKQKYGIAAVRPLADNTQRRVVRGLDKFVLHNAQPFIVPIGYGERAGQLPRSHGIESPLPTVTASGKHYLCTPIPTIVSKAETCLVAPHLIQYHTEQRGEYVRGQSVERPIDTIDAAGRYGLAAANLVKYYGAGTGQAVDAPAHTITTKDREALQLSYLQKYYAGGNTEVGADVNAPLPTVTAIDHNARVATHVVKFKGTNLGHEMDKPLQTITASAGKRDCGGGTFGLCHTYLVQAAPGVPLGRWPRVRELLNRYCGYNIQENEVLILEIGDTPYFIADIGLRMLTPRELYNANGFPPDYIIERDYTGAAYNKSKQVARCGNAVPPPFATALVRANWPERCAKTYTTMAELERTWAV